MTPSAIPRPDAPDWMRPLGRTGLPVSAISAGGSGIGSVPAVFGEEVDEDRAARVLEELLDSPVRLIDTSNGYSDGESERRIGRALAARGGPPEDFLVTTKVDGRDGDFSAERVRRSAEESCDRLGLDRLPLLHLHDPEFYPEQDFFAPGGPLEALVELRERGLADHLGIATGSIEMAHRFLDTGHVDALLMHSRCTLVDRSADALYDRAAAEGVGILNAAVLGAGLLARPSPDHRLYGYQPVRPEVRQAALDMDRIAREAGLDLAALAIGFSLRDPRISSTVVGFSTPGRIDRTLQALSVPVPEEIWDRLEEAVPPPRAWLH